MDKIKLFFLSDDIRATSGVSNQANKLLRGLVKTGKYEIIHGAVAINHNKIPFEGKSSTYHNIRIYNLPSTRDNAGDDRILSWILNSEEPDIFVCFGDPRFFTYLFLRDNEIRSHCKLVLYHTWDNGPFPVYNLPWYQSNDYVVTISQLANSLLNSGGVENTYIPHGYDPSEFYRLPDDEITKQKEAFFDQIRDRFPNNDFKKIIFWNNRNLARKRPLDLMKAFADYCKTYKDTVLLMHTNPIGVGGGTDLLSFYDSLEGGDVPIAFSDVKLDSSKLNMLYNIADVSVNISYSEGFGLCIGESLLAETPVLAVKTGGIKEQMTDGRYAWGLLFEPEMSLLSGFLTTPYIYEDYVSRETITSGFEYLLQKIHPLELHRMGKEGREFIVQNYHTNNIIAKWDEFLTLVNNKKSNLKKYELIKI